MVEFTAFASRWLDYWEAYALSIVMLLVIFLPLERRFPFARGQALLRPQLATDFAFLTGQYLVFNGLIAAALNYLATWLHDEPSWAWLAHLRHSATLVPLPVALLLAVIAGDVVVYWFHRACHRFDVLWRFHRVHHTSTTLDFWAAHREHPLDGLTTGFAQNLPLILFGLPGNVLAGVVTFRAIWAVFIHSNVQLPLGPLSVLFGSPELHHYHHALDRRTGNFANLAPWLDKLFGTYVKPAAPYAIGVPNDAPRSYLAHMVSPFQRSGGEVVSAEAAPLGSP